MIPGAIADIANEEVMTPGTVPVGTNAVFAMVPGAVPVGAKPELGIVPGAELVGASPA